MVINSKTITTAQDFNVTYRKGKFLWTVKITDKLYSASTCLCDELMEPLLKLSLYLLLAGY